jgi:DNA-binding NarL/FixJ family response regulator
MPERQRVITVLLVDDHRLVLRAFKRMLEDELDLRVVGEARSGKEAVKAAQQLRPDVVVMDFAVPGITGAAATQRILEKVRGTAVLMLSMHSEPIYVRAALDAGASGYLLKSAVEMELAGAVRKVAAGLHVLDSRIAPPTPRSGEGTRPLSTRELEVLQLIAQGKSNKQIASALCISAGTVNVHRANIMQELAVHNTATLTLYAIARGLVKIA